VFFLKSLFKAGSFPKIRTQTVPKYVLWMRILDTGFPVDFKNMDLAIDSEYEVPGCDDLKKIIAACPSSSYVFIKNSRDCDDFVRIFLGYLSQEGHGNLSIGWVRGWLEAENKRIYHAMCWALTIRHLWLFDPQNNNYCWKWGDKIKIPGFTQFTPDKMGI
jgi:hypothetical protein